MDAENGKGEASRPEESGGGAARRLREQLQRELGEVPVQSPSEPEQKDDETKDEDCDARTK